MRSMNSNARPMLLSAVFATLILGGCQTPMPGYTAAETALMADRRIETLVRKVSCNAIEETRPVISQEGFESLGEADRDELKKPLAGMDALACDEVLAPQESLP